jgi:hypothetical protein
MQGNGEVVRWDADEGLGAVVVTSLAGEVEFRREAVEGGIDLQPGLVVDVEWNPGEPHPVATRVVPAGG